MINVSGWKILKIIYLAASAKNVPAYEKAEDPGFVLANNIPIDTKHYLTNQVCSKIIQILTYF